MTHPVPDAVLAQHVAVVGKTGAGKSYAAKGMVERLLEQGRRVCIIDPTSAWWGLRAAADGTKAGYPVAVFGGEHADVPIAASSGAALAEIVGRHNLPCVVDLSEMLIGARHSFMEAFAAGLYAVNRQPLHLVIDEADEFAPQNPLPETKRMLHQVDRIVRRGRIRGFRVMMITQRPAVLHKNVLTQANTLIAMRLTAPQDRKAIESWVQGQADARQGREVLDSLARLPRGEGWVWSPEHSVLERVRFPRIRTFDSGRTPEDGAAIAEPTQLADVDLHFVRHMLEHATAEAEANDPAKLRAQVAQMRTEVATLRAQVAAAVAVDPEALAAARDEGHREGLRIGRIQGRRQAGERLTAAIQGTLSALAQEESYDPGPARTVADVEAKPAAPPPPPPPPPARPAKPPSGAMHPAARKLLAAASNHRERPLTWEQLCTVAGLIPGNGYFYGGRKDLLERGHVIERDGRVVISPAGITASGIAIGRPSQPTDIVALWSAKLRPPAPQMLAALSAANGRALPVADLARAVELKPGNGYWYGGIASLREAGLVEQDGSGGAIRLTELLR